MFIIKHQKTGNLTQTFVTTWNLERILKLIKFKNYYVRPKMDDSALDNYFTERYKHNLTIQAKIAHVNIVYSEKDTRHQNPIIEVELVDVRNASDGEFIREFVQGYPDPDDRQLYFDGKIKEGNYIQYQAKITVLEKTASAQYNAPKFVQNHLPTVMPFIKSSGKYAKIEIEDVKPIVKGVLFDRERY